MARLRLQKLAAGWCVSWQSESVSQLTPVPPERKHAGCMLGTYAPADTSMCLRSRQVVFIGDSVTRQLFFQFANLVDPKLPDALPDDNNKHSNYTLEAESKAMLSFYWDPYMNSSYSRLIHPTGTDRAPSSASDRPALLVLGTGLWYLRHEDSGGLPAWEARVEAVIDTIRNANPPLADKIIFLPVEEPVTSKLSPERAKTIRISDVDAMNSDLFHRIHFSHNSPPTTPLRSPHHISFPSVLNQMLDDSQTVDGLHFSSPIIKAQANLLLNFRCNDVLYKEYPFDKTCCRSYPIPPPLYLLVICVVCLAAPALSYYSYRAGLSLLYSVDSHIYSVLAGKINLATGIGDEYRPAIIMSGAVALMYVADRTGFWFKEQKQFDPWFFGSLSVLALVAGIATVKRGDNDLGFLNREQTDEWKGWMQSESLSKFPSGIKLMFSVGSRHFDLPLHWSLEDFRNLQPNSSLGRCIPLHDGVWPHHLLPKKGRLWFPSRCTGEYFSFM